VSTYILSASVSSRAEPSSLMYTSILIVRPKTSLPDAVMPALGQNQTSDVVHVMSALLPKADIAEHERDAPAIFGSLDIVFGEIDR
jgi:hypothetical protein